MPGLKGLKKKAPTIVVEHGATSSQRKKGHGKCQVVVVTLLIEIKDIIMETRDDGDGDDGDDDDTPLKTGVRYPHP